MEAKNIGKKIKEGSKRLTFYENKGVKKIGGLGQNQLPLLPMSQRSLAIHVICTNVYSFCDVYMFILTL